MAGLLVSASTGAMGSLLGKLGTMLSDEYNLLKGVRHDIKFLKDELEAMQAFLLMMADEEEPDPRDKLRSDVVRELSYEIEDSIDKFMLLVESDDSSTKSDGLGKLLNKSMKKITDIKTRHKIAKDVKDIKSQVKEISERYARYTIHESSKPKNEKVDPRILALYKDASELAGIDGPTDELVKWISSKKGESAHQVKVASIVGYGGLGKTTLARQVYKKLGANFECRAFVPISRNPDMTKIFGSILSEISNGKEHARSTYQQIIDQIRYFLKDKRYFIVIDDVWDKHTWKTLDCALVKNNCGSVIMTTTRTNDVAESCCSSDGNLVYKIKPLGDDDSKKLFFKRIFGSEEKCPPNLREASKDILRKCGGLPLAINAISGLLATGKTKEEWDRVRSSIGFAQGKSSDIDAMNYILSLSYFDLPLHLRSCLLYLTMFPEDYVIQRKRLVQRWVSEGFIRSIEGGDLVELGEKYFHELVNRSLIQLVNIGYDGKAKYCRVHDTILDFLIYKCTSEKFCTLLSNNFKPDGRIRRLSLTSSVSSDGKGSVEQLDLSHARSLGIFQYSQEYRTSLVKSNALRVLDLGYCSGLENRCVKDIGRLFQLRYLNIRRTKISELPREIGNLVHLETLDATRTQLVELPESITRLIRLARLFVDYKTKIPDGIGQMKNLQELSRICPFEQSPNFLEELGKLTNLRKLRILWESKEPDKECKGEKVASSLRKLERCKLRNLSIEFNCCDEILMAGKQLCSAALKSIRKITTHAGYFCWSGKWLVSLMNLEILVIRGEITQQDVELIGSSPALLELRVHAEKWPIVISGSSGGFQQLQKLDFCSSPYSSRGRMLMIEAGAMPNLKELTIDVTESSAAADDDIGIQHLSSLASLRVMTRWVSMEDVKVVEDVKAAFKRIVDAHPNRPTLEMMGIEATIRLRLL